MCVYVGRPQASKFVSQGYERISDSVDRISVHSNKMIHRMD